MRAQPGIFALGTTEHAYLELDLVDGTSPRELAAALAGLLGPDTPASGGVNVVVGLRPELWAEVIGRPPQAASMRPVEGTGFSMPATQRDAWVWLAGGGRDVVWAAALRVIRALEPVASVATEVNGWLYRYDHDLTGFEDGTENPSMLEAPAVATDESGAGVVLVQQWRHAASFAGLSVPEQEAVIGRTKDGSVELAEDVMPADSHVSRTVVEVDGEELEIFRRNTAWGGPAEHGTMFVGFCREQAPLALMLDRMAGVGDGIRDALTRYTAPLTGAYYVVPALAELAELAGG